MRPRRTAVRPAALVLAILFALLIPEVVPTPVAAEEVTHTYRVEGRDHRTSLSRFARLAAETLADDRGWNLGGSMRFRQVESGGDFTLWLASPRAVTTFGSVCSANYSCRVGRNVVINEDNFNHATPAWNRAGEGLRDYQHMVVNHEVGHWLGFGHVGCPSAGSPAPLMMQQSKGFGGCRPNPWPTASEREEAARRYGVPVRRGPAPREIYNDLSTAPSGYRILKGDGSLFGYGGASYHGSAFGATAAVAVEAEQVPGADGYWVATSDGSLFGFGEAAYRYHGSPRDRGVTEGVVSMAAHPGGQGYWIALADGRVLAFGSAGDHGSAGGASSSPVIEVVGTSTGNGYWLATADGGVLGYGDAASRYRGSPRDVGKTEGLVAMARTLSGEGYWLASGDGSVFGFGDAEYLGSMGGRLAHPLRDMAAGPSGGYRLLGSDGAVFTFGASYAGSAAG